MKITTKIFLSSIAALTMTGCSSDIVNDIDNNGQDNKIIREFFANREDVGTRTSINDDKNVYNGFSLTWTEKDSIFVHDGTQSGVYNVRQEGNWQRNAAFDLVKGEGVGEGKDAYFIYYPAKDFVSIDPVDSIFTVDLDSEQQYWEDDIDDDVLPMVAVHNDNNIHFRNAGAMLRIRLSALPADQARTDTLYMQRIVVTTKGEHVCGKSKIKYNGGQPQFLGAASGTDNWHVVQTLKVNSNDTPDGVPFGRMNGAKRDTVDYYIVLPAQKYKAGLNLGFYLKAKESGDVYVASYTTNAEINFLRSKVHTITLAAKTTAEVDGKGYLRDGYDVFSTVEKITNDQARDIKHVVILTKSTYVGLDDDATWRDNHREMKPDGVPVYRDYDHESKTLFITTPAATIVTDDEHDNDAGKFFQNMYSLQSITGLDKIDFSPATKMTHMFYDNAALQSLDLSSVNSANVQAMRGMFEGCNSLKTIQFGPDFTTSNVTDMKYMFKRCYSLESLDLSSFDFSNVTEYAEMFKNCNPDGVVKLTKVYVKDEAARTFINARLADAGMPQIAEIKVP